ncbi:S-4TM family putative pore-forming effector [Escherichia coli]|uniref:S-4TM family putative pore-forming effector n=1 Tax=Escherichia coli TaxID=562 RepID=UPI001F1F59A2|nr:S-4TM family putative pore-forming effector [Escherichia coli]MCF6541067.1 S-4TM family putative pore-forming effector [Escherichia coli]
MNAIYTNQSTRENMDLLYAQARVYDRVKNWNRLNFLFSIIVPLLLSFVTVYNRSREFVDSELLSSLLGLYGLLVLTFNIVISGHISALRRKAASIQEMYDCRVLGIRRNEPRQPGGCKLKTAPVRPVVAARPAEYVCSEDLFY